MEQTTISPILRQMIQTGETSSFTAPQQIQPMLQNEAIVDTFEKQDTQPKQDFIQKNKSLIMGIITALALVGAVIAFKNKGKIAEFFKGKFNKEVKADDTKLLPAPKEEVKAEAPNANEANLAKVDSEVTSSKVEEIKTEASKTITQEPKVEAPKTMEEQNAILKKIGFNEEYYELLDPNKFETIYKNLEMVQKSKIGELGFNDDLLIDFAKSFDNKEMEELLQKSKGRGFFDIWDIFNDALLAKKTALENV